MNERIEQLGRVISAQTVRNSGRAARLLSLTYRALGAQAGHFPSKKHLPSREYLQAYTANLLADLLKDPSGSAVVNIFMPNEIFHALGMKIMAPEALAAYVANTACERLFIEKAEEEGAPESFCSYHKLLLGLAESGVLRAPALVANTTLACDANQLTFRRLAELWDVPHILIDVPYDVSEDAVNYVAAQLRALAHTAEDLTHRALNPDLLRASMLRSGEQIRNFKAYLRRRPDVHLPEAMTPELLNIAANHIYMGSPEALTYSRLLLRDVKRAPKRGPEKHILWMHVLPNWQTPLCELFQGAQNHRAEIVACDLACGTLTEPDPDRPFESMARRLVFDSFNGPGSRRIDAALQLAKQLRADGILLFCQWGCKQTQGLALTAKRLLEAEGFPTLLLDGDGCDRANGASGQILTRANAFIEQLESAGRY